MSTSTGIEPTSPVKPPHVSAMLLRTMARDGRAMAEAYEKRNLRESAEVERMKAEDLDEASEHLMSYGRMLSEPSKRFTVRDSGRWGWLIRDNDVGKDLMTNKLDEDAARSLAEGLNTDPPTSLVYADPPFPDDESSQDHSAPANREIVYRVEVGANVFYFGDEVGDVEKVARFWRETGAQVTLFERPRHDVHVSTSERQ